MCSLDWTGWNPTNEICMERMVPKQYTCMYTYMKQVPHDHILMTILHVHIYISII